MYPNWSIHDIVIAERRKAYFLLEEAGKRHPVVPHAIEDASAGFVRFCAEATDGVSEKFFFLSFFKNIFPSQDTMLRHASKFLKQLDNIPEMSSQ